MGGTPMLAYAYNFLQRQDHGPTPFERLLRRDRAIVGIALLILILLAWLYVGQLVTSMEVAGLDTTGTRMVSTGTRMVTVSSLQPWSEPKRENRTTIPTNSMNVTTKSPIAIRTNADRYCNWLLILIPISLKYTRMESNKSATLDHHPSHSCFKDQYSGNHED